ncbi:hypothetical protein GCM10020220_009780 [Nonomuraea rubra]
MVAARGVRRAMALVLVSVTTVLTIGVASSPAHAWNPANDGWYKCYVDGKWMWCKDL